MSDSAEIVIKITPVADDDMEISISTNLEQTSLNWWLDQTKLMILTGGYKAAAPPDKSGE